MSGVPRIASSPENLWEAFLNPSRNLSNSVKSTLVMPFLGSKFFLRSDCIWFADDCMSRNAARVAAAFRWESMTRISPKIIATAMGTAIRLARRAGRTQVFFFSCGGRYGGGIGGGFMEPLASF